jgi:hypothetical protein
MEPLNSLGLRGMDGVVGWVITHRIAPATVRYTALFVDERVRRLGHGIALLAEAMRRQMGALGDDSVGTFGVWLHNAPMIRFVRRRMAPYLISMAETRSARKQL